MRQETEVHFLFCTVILGLLSIFKKSQALSLYKALNSVCLSRVQRDVRPPVQMRLKPMAFPRVSTGNSVMPSSCEMKDEPEFKPLQGNRAFFWVRASRGRFHLRQKTQGPSHIPTAGWKLLLRCLWEAGTDVHKDRDSALILGWYGVHGALFELLYWN